MIHRQNAGQNHYIKIANNYLKMRQSSSTWEQKLQIKDNEIKTMLNLVHACCQSVQNLLPKTLRIKITEL